MKMVCSPDEQNKIDQLVNVMQMISTYDIFFHG